MHNVILKNDAVGDLIHSVTAIKNIISSSEKTTIFLSERSKDFDFLFQDKRVEIKILNYNLTILEKVKILFFLISKRINKIYILSPKKFYYFLPVLFLKKKFYGLCVNNINNYKRPNLFLRKFLFKFEVNHRDKVFKRDSTKILQERLTAGEKKINNFSLNLNIKMSEELRRYIPKNYIYFHFKKKTCKELNWEFKDLNKLIEEFSKYSDNVILTKDIESDEYRLLFKDSFNSYDFLSKKFIIYGGPSGT